MTAEPYYGKNVIVEENQVAVVLPLDLLGCGAITIAYLLVLSFLADNGFPLERFSLLHILIFVAATAVWGWYMARRRIVTTFDGNARTVYRKNFFGMVKSISFDEVAAVVPVQKTGPFTGGKFYYTLRLANDLHGAGLVLTNPLAEDNAEYRYFCSVALPRIQEFFDAGSPERSSGEDFGAVAAAFAAVAAPEWELPERPRFFRRRGDRYIRKSRGVAMGAFFLSLLFLCGFLAVLSNEKTSATLLFPLCLSGLFFWFAMSRVVKVVFDTESGVIRYCHWLGMRVKRSIGFENFTGFHTTRHYTNGIYTGTTLEMCFSEGKNMPALMSALFTKKITAFSSEVEQIVFATLYPDGAVGGDGVNVSRTASDKQGVSV